MALGRSTGVSSLLFIVILFLVSSIFIARLVPTVSFAQNFTEKKHVLVLNSYHKGYKWSDNVTEGISSVLGPDARNICVQIEEMDTQRILADDAYLNKLYEIYKYKFGNKKFDVIICSDDAAFYFLCKYRDQLFPGTPVVFCGVNYFKDPLLVGHDKFTGVVENFDIKTTLETALKIHPNTKNIYIINDKTISGAGAERALAETIQAFSNVNFISLGENSMAEIRDKVQRLPDDSLVLFLLFFQDVMGNRFAYDESIRLVAEQCKVPIYGVWDFALGHGIVGGMLTSGYSQGEMAAKMALRILNGERPEVMPVVKESPNAFMFDEIQMKRFGIRNSDLPENSIIINQSYSDKKQILVLNSYDPEMLWERKIEDGIQAVFANDKNVTFYTDYMDVKRNPSPTYLQKLYDSYKYKYSNKKFDAIITTDDAAYDFMLQYHKELFPNTPVIFCGLNNADKAALKDNEWFTGSIETIDIKTTIDTALKFHPNTKQIIVINDKTPIGQSTKKLLEEIIPAYSKQGLQFTFIEDVNMSEVQERVANAPEDSFILMFSFNRDKSNNVFSYEEAIGLVVSKSKVPIYGVWDNYIGYGLVGGMLTSGYAIGEEVGKLTKRILNGEKVSKFPVVGSPQKYMFDYQQMLRFGIKEDQLPSNSIVINRPQSFYTQHRTLVWGVGTFITMLCIIICVLYVNIQQRRKAEKELQVYATIDPMTGVLNRRTGLLFLEEQVALANRNKKELTICFIDANDLKKVNDTYGHTEGDKLIRCISTVLKEIIRKSDIVCRFGGDEFLLILPNCNIEQAEVLWQRIVERLEEYNAQKLHEFEVSVSHGFAEYHPDSPIDVDKLVKTADDAMYREKSFVKNADYCQTLLISEV